MNAEPSPFPACRHRRRRPPPASGGLAWLAGEPFRLFFPAGLLWSLAGVLLWPLFYAGELHFHPGIAHARLMIQGFGGALVLGFLGTAGPRMASAPKWTALECLGLFLLHSTGCLLHLGLHYAAGDLAFLLALTGLTAGLLVRVARFRREWPPPQLLLALTGLGCGIAGTLLWLLPNPVASLPRQHLANLLVYQGLLLPPVLGIGSFLFPRLLGGDFRTSDSACCAPCSPPACWSPASCSKPGGPHVSVRCCVPARPPGTCWSKSAGAATRAPPHAAP